MPTTHTQDQITNALSAETWPIFLVQIEIGSPQEYLSCTSEVTYDGNTYTAGAARVTRLNRRAATVEIRLTAARITQVERGDWIGGVCKIWYIPGAYGDSGTYTTADSMLYLDGIIDVPSVTADGISITVNQKYLQGQMVGLYMDNICNHIPAAGTVTNWEGEKLTNQSPKNGYRNRRRRNQRGSGLTFGTLTNRSGTAVGTGTQLWLAYNAEHGLPPENREPV